jgi:hypothetical protein
MKRPVQPVEVTVYRITGRQGIIEVPHRYCEECDLTVQLVQRVINEVGNPRVTLTVRPWMLWFWKPLLRGGWHAPIVTVNGRIISQGVVPAIDAVSEAIQAAAGMGKQERDESDQLASTR